MDLKTQIKAEQGEQQIFITRNFDIPVALLYKAYTEAEFLEQWMNTKVLKLTSENHGSYRFETTDPRGQSHFFSGAIHECTCNQSIIRTFEMEGTSFPPQLEFMTFEPLTADTSNLTIQIVYKSVTDRDNMLKLPFAQGLNWAHERLEACMKNLKTA